MVRNISNNNNIIVSDNGKKYQKPSIYNRVGAYFIAGAVAQEIQKCPKIFTISVKNAIKTDNLPKGQNIADAGYAILQKTGLDKKGVAIRNVEEDALSKSFAVLDILDELPEQVKQKVEKNPSYAKKILARTKFEINSVGDGTNALCTKNDKIFINLKKVPYMVFHEIGHAVIHHNKAAKYLSKYANKGVFLGSLFLPLVLLKRKKADEEKPKNNFDKALTFLRDNAAKFAFLGWLPRLLNEGGASIIGAKLAKPFLSQADYKAINKFHRKAFLTYAGRATGVATSVYCAKKICDYMTKPKEIKSDL